ncbi:polysaccharide pyruvyl transferase family protein [Arthrobacter sp. RIT-PI-e]|uniref:polysaccharide pyruvyl transferase family protein n=1 Tax=Arthrobacter sp. RIT-PI-e TaxID=1681197 RepID=UPI000ADC9740|nr:polysaccharide pyruvyl transferase family protein [Arthrobacter sp. RIT-PI-e]
MRLRKRTTEPPLLATFVNPSGQRDNLGDSVLRRAYLDALRKTGNLHIYVGDNEDYVSALGIRADDVTYLSKKKWLLSAIKHRNSGLIFAANAGEYVLNKRFLVNASWQFFLALIANSSKGGSSIAMGISIRPGYSRTSLRVLRVLLKRIKIVSWRDSLSRDAVGLGAVAPDWAFTLGEQASVLEASSGRRKVAIALRGDRPAPSESWVRGVREFASEKDLDVVVVNQMRRDRDRCAELAARFDATTLDWGVESHAEHELRVRKLYRESVVVISDRIHVLILGLSEGAVPVGLTTSDPEKIVRTFEAMSPIDLAWRPTEETSPDQIVEFINSLIANRSHLVTDLDNARKLVEKSISKIGN